MSHKELYIQIIAVHIQNMLLIPQNDIEKLHHLFDNMQIKRIFYYQFMSH